MRKAISTFFTGVSFVTQMQTHTHIQI